MFIRKLIKVLIPLAIVAAGLVAANHLYATKPTAKRMRPPKLSPLVEVMEAQIGSHQVVIEAMGTVTASRTISLKPQVSGRVVEMAPGFVPGGLLQADEVILKLDPTDYELAVKKQKSEVSRALADMQLEQGRQAVAQNELRLMNSISGKKVKDTALALRQPQLAQAQANVAVAKAALEQAELDLKRTVVRAPFNCLVSSRAVNLGSQVSVQETLATLVGADFFWIETAVPVDRLRWLDIPMKNDDQGNPARIESQTGARRQGRVVRLLGDVNDQSRMARIMIEIPDPLGLKSGEDGPPLLLGSYVSVRIDGSRIDGVVRLPRPVLRDGDVVWLLVDGRLAMRPVEVVWRDRDSVYIGGGLEVGERVIASEISAPVEGMELRADGEEPQGENPQGEKPGGEGGGKRGRPKGPGAS